MAEVALAPGQRVTWYHVLNGGYTFEQAIPAIVVGHKGKRVKIAVLRANEDIMVMRYVTPERLGPPMPIGDAICEKILSILIMQEMTK